MPPAPDMGSPSSEARPALIDVQTEYPSRPTGADAPRYADGTLLSQTLRALTDPDGYYAGLRRFDKDLSRLGPS